MGQGISPPDLKYNQERWKKVALHSVYRDPYNKDNDSATCDRQKDNNSLRLMSGIHLMKIMTVIGWQGKRSQIFETGVRDPSNEDNGSALGDREKDHNSLRLVSGIHTTKIMTVQHVTGKKITTL